MNQNRFAKLGQVIRARHSHSAYMPPIQLWKPHEAQRAIVDFREGHPEGQRGMAKTGRQGGKTSGAGILAGGALKLGLRTLYIAPADKQTKTFWEVITDQCKEDGRRKLTNSPRRVSYTGHPGFIEAVTAWNPDLLRGGHYHLVILDEFQLMKEDIWERVVPPMLLRYNGNVLFILTPPSIRTKHLSKARDVRYALKLFRAAEKKPHWSTIHFASQANTYLTEAAFALLIEDMPKGAYNQEILALDDEDDDAFPFKREWFTVFPAVPDHEIPVAIVRHWDIASTENAGDFSCGLLLVRTNADRYYIADVHRGQWGPARLKAELKKKAIEDHQRFTGPIAPLWSFPQDPGAAGVIAAADLVKHVRRYCRREPVVERETGAKPVRALPVIATADPVEGPGNLMLTEGPWNEDFLDEIELFPYGDYDDQVDALSGAHAQAQTAVRSLVVA